MTLRLIESEEMEILWRRLRVQTEGVALLRRLMTEGKRQVGLPHSRWPPEIPRSRRDEETVTR